LGTTLTNTNEIHDEILGNKFQEILVLFQLKFIILLGVYFPKWWRPGYTKNNSSNGYV